MLVYQRVAQCDGVICCHIGDSGSAFLELFYVIDLRFISVDVVYLYNWKEAWSTNSSILDTNPIDVAILTLVVFMFRQLACTRYLACSWMVSLKLHCWRCPVGCQKGTIQLLKLKPHIMASWWISCTLSPEKGPFQKLSSSHPLLGAIGQYFF